MLYESELRELWGSRFARLSAALVFAGYLIAALVIARGSEPAPLEAITANALFWLVWTSGALVAVSAARNAERIEHKAELIALLRQRGLPSAALRAARPWAIALRVARLIGIPMLALGVLGIALSHSPALLASRLVFVALLVGYVVLVAAALALLTDLSLRLTPERAGWTLVALIVIPHLARSVWPLTPSAPALFSWLLGGIRSIASALT